MLLGLYVYAQDFDIYVSDAGNFNNPPWKIFKYDSSGGNAVTFIDTMLSWPQDILFLEDSDLVLISNLNTNRITKYDSDSGNYLGIFANGMSGPTRMKIGPDTLLYVLQWSGNGRVKRYRLDGSFHSNFTSIGVNQSIGMDWDQKGNLYVSSFNGKNIRKFGPTGADSGLFVNSNLQGPTNIWFDDNGELLVLDWSGTTVKRFDTNGVFVSNYLTGLRQSEGVDFMPTGNILIGNGWTKAVKMYDSSGSFIRDLVPSGRGGLLKPNAVRIRLKSNLTSVQKLNPIIEELSIHPTYGNLFFIETQNWTHSNELNVVDINGRVVFETRVNKSITIWEANNEENGMYFINYFNSKGQKYSKKVMVIK